MFSADMGCKQVKELLLRFASRSEKYDSTYLKDTFVDVGAVCVRLSSFENQALFGRRGTGKTHVLRYLFDQKNQSGELSVFIDMRLLGSSGGVYADAIQSPSVRATRMFVDFVLCVHEQILAAVMKNPVLDPNSNAVDVLNKIADAITAREIDGPVDFKVSEEDARSFGSNFGISFSKDGVGATAAASSGQTGKETIEVRKSGSEKIHFNIALVSRLFSELLVEFPRKKLWIFLDEWSEIPLDVQPFLANLIKQVFFPLQSVAIKIAAIEHRSNFRTTLQGVAQIGIELGAEMPNSLSLDGILVFDNDRNKSKEFFSKLIFNHLDAEYKNNSALTGGFFSSAADLVKVLFSRVDAFEEFVRATEGVPRDAISILAQMAQNYDDNKISIPEVRSAAKICYQRYKYKDVAANDQAPSLLSWIIDSVLGKKQARAFLVEVGSEDKLFDYLYDSRVVHLIKQGVSGQDEPGKRFNVYSIDYGCYVDLIKTKREPSRLFDVDFLDADDNFDVPVDDYRSIRRAILVLSDFYESRKSEQLSLL